MKLIITEEQKKYLAEKIISEDKMPVPKKVNKPFCINPDKVLLVKKYLDSTFTPHNYEKIINGYPTTIKIVSMNSSVGDNLKYLYQDQLFDLLNDKFQKMFSTKEERELFLAQVINDWLYGKITCFGGLSVNYLG